MRQAIEYALRKKTRARSAREKGEYHRAAEHIDAALRQLEALWEERGAAIDRAGTGASGEERDLIEALADIHGIRGGIYRSLEKYADAVKAYDRGLKFEAHPARNVASSYNLVQRLANRALLQPEEIGRDAWRVENMDMWAELRQAEATLRKQTESSRARDPWAWADLLFIQLLLAPRLADGGRTIEETWSTLEGLSPKPFVYESTGRALADLRNEMESVPATARSPGWTTVKEWLDRLHPRFEERGQRSGAE